MPSAAAAAPGPPPESGRVEWFYSEQPDPVFDGMVKDFCSFNDSLQAIHERLEEFLTGVEALAEGLRDLSDGVVARFVHLRDRKLASDSCQMREATNQIAHAEAPHSAVAKLRRNMDFNVITPIKEHLENNDRLRKEMEKRQRRLDELRIAKRQIDECLRCNLSETDSRFRMAKAEFETSSRCFRKVDRQVFEWLYLLEEYRADILDSSLQTLKYLQYEFFAAAAHALARALPDRMTFRPMREMAPECLERQVEDLREAHGLESLGLTVAGNAVGSRFSERLVERLALSSATEAPAAPVDPLSLSSLLAQGFDEAPARRALRLHANDTQAALECLLRGGGGAVLCEDGPRRPTAHFRDLPPGPPLAGEAAGAAVPGPRPTELGLR